MKYPYIILQTSNPMKHTNTTVNVTSYSDGANRAFRFHVDPTYLDGVYGEGNWKITLRGMFYTYNASTYGYAEIYDVAGASQIDEQVFSTTGTTPGYEEVTFGGTYPTTPKMLTLRFKYSGTGYMGYMCDWILGVEPVIGSYDEHQEIRLCTAATAPYSTYTYNSTTYSDTSSRAYRIHHNPTLWDTVFGTGNWEYAIVGKFAVANAATIQKVELYDRVGVSQIDEQTLSTYLGSTTDMQEEDITFGGTYPTSESALRVAMRRDPASTSANCYINNDFKIVVRHI